MWGVLLTAISTFLEELSAAIGKDRVSKKAYSIYTFGWIQSSAAAVFFLAIALIKHETFLFSSASLPFFTLRVFLEMVLAHTSRAAITIADRSTFSFIRVGTIPLVLGIDWMLGYQLTTYHLAGIGVIIVALVLVFSRQTITRAGVGLTVLSTVLAAVTISLFKYDIAHYNSVVAEQLLVYICIVGYFTVGSLLRAKERPWHSLRQPIVIFQAFLSGVTGVVDSFAYVFAPASVIIAARRSSAVLWSIATGRFYFKEINVVFKVCIASILIGGIILLTWSL